MPDPTPNRPADDRTLDEILDKEAIDALELPEWWVTKTKADLRRWHTAEMRAVLNRSVSIVSDACDTADLSAPDKRSVMESVKAAIDAELHKLEEAPME